MLDVVTETFLRKKIRTILYEGEAPVPAPEQKQKKKRVSRRAQGRFIIKSSVPGAPPKGMRLADPKKIMDNLNAEGSYKGSEDPIAALEELLDKAISGTEAMGKAYGGVQPIEDSYGRSGVTVSMGELDANNGARFMKITLSAAKDTGMLVLDEDIRVQVGGNGVIIYRSKNGAATWEKPQEKR